MTLNIIQTYTTINHVSYKITNHVQRVIEIGQVVNPVGHGQSKQVNKECSLEDA